MNSQWFWCKHFAHIFILYSKCSKKIYRLPILYLNTAGYSLWVPSVVFLCLGGKKRSVTIPHCVSGGAWSILTFTSCMPEHMCVETEELLKEGCHHLICKKSNDIKINIKQTAFNLNVPYTTFGVTFSTSTSLHKKLMHLNNSSLCLKRDFLTNGLSTLA